MSTNDEETGSIESGSEDSKEGAIQNELWGVIKKVIMMKCHLCSDEADINILLYLGFVLVAVGVIITSVGLGERGFRTLELRMVGPCLLGLGVMMVTLRLLFCSGLPCTRGLAQQGEWGPTSQ